jgi:putative transposase
MAKWKRHSQADVAVKLLQAEALAAQGKRQQDVALALGISVMTIHRWRKAQPARAPAQSVPSSHPSQIGQCLSPEGDSGRIAELELENLRLRRLLTDALLEKIKLEEAYPRRNMSNGLSGPAAH